MKIVLFLSASSTKGILFFKLTITKGINFCFLLYGVNIPNAQTNHNNSDTKNIFVNDSSVSSSCTHIRSYSKAWIGLDGKFAFFMIVGFLFSEFEVLGWLKCIAFRFSRKLAIPFFRI